MDFLVIFLWIIGVLVMHSPGVTAVQHFCRQTTCLSVFQQKSSEIQSIQKSIQNARNTLNQKQQTSQKTKRRLEIYQNTNQNLRTEESRLQQQEANLNKEYTEKAKEYRNLRNSGGGAATSSSEFQSKKQESYNRQIQAYENENSKLEQLRYKQGTALNKIKKKKQIFEHQNQALLEEIRILKEKISQVKGQKEADMSDINEEEKLKNEMSQRKEEFEHLEYTVYPRATNDLRNCQNNRKTYESNIDHYDKLTERCFEDIEYSRKLSISRMGQSTYDQINIDCTKKIGEISRRNLGYVNGIETLKRTYCPGQ